MNGPTLSSKVRAGRAVLRLPRSPFPPGRATGKVPPRPDVLVVDDDPTAAVFVHETLAEAGLTVAVAGSGVEALRMVAAVRPRLLVLDVSMPGLDGYAVCRRLRAEPASSRVPVLFLSSKAAVSARVTGLRSGGIDFLGKPVAAAELVARVRAQLEQVSAREDLSSHNQELAAANTALRSGLDSAVRVQAAMMPSLDPGEARVRFVWRCVQCERIGGDAVSVLRLSEDVYAFYVLDASGHGVPASLLAVASGYFVAALAANLLSTRSASFPPSPAAVLDSVNRVLFRLAPPGAFVTAIVGTFNANDRQLRFASAGHPGPVLIRAGHPPETLDEPAPPAGVREWEYADRVVTMGSGDRLVICTDGLFEQRNADGRHFGRVRMSRSLADLRDASLDDAVEWLMADVSRWRGARPVDDDVSLLAIEVE